MAPVAFGRLLQEAFGSWSDDYAPSMGAALAYYTLFSIAPLLLIVISVAGLVFGAQAARGEILDQLAGLIGSDSARAVEALLESVNRPESGLLHTALGVVVLLIGATTVFGELQDAMDRIWRVQPLPRHGSLWRLARARLLSLSMVLGLGFLLMVSLVVSAALAAFGRVWNPWLVDSGLLRLADAIDIAFNLVFLTVVFAAIYRWLPRRRLRWGDVAAGAVMAALMFTAGKTLIGTYIGHSGMASTFGAAASLVALMVWVYYSAQIFLLGAEFTRVYATRCGSLAGTRAAGSAGAVAPGSAAASATAPPRRVPDAHGVATTTAP